MKRYQIKQKGAVLRLFVYLTLMAVLLLLLTGAVAQATPVQQDAPAAPASAAAVGSTYNVFNTSCDRNVPNSIGWAMDQANANPGTDTIGFVDSLQGKSIGVVNCPNLPGVSDPVDAVDYFAIQATESVIIEGNGVKVQGIINWVDTGGAKRPPGGFSTDCPGDPRSPSLQIATSPGFIKVGQRGQDNSAITVTVRNLELDTLNSVARIEKNASLILEDVVVKNTIPSFSRSCLEHAVTVEEGANFTARRTQWLGITSFEDVDISFPSSQFYSGATILGAGGAGAGNLTIEDSFFGVKNQGGGIQWNGQSGSEVNIVTSRFDYHGGFSIGGEGTTNIVNTIWTHPNPLVAGSRIYNSSRGEMNIRASTILNFDTVCGRECQAGTSAGLIYRYPNSVIGKINLAQSAIEVAFPDLGTPAVKVLDSPAGDGFFTADEYTWVRPTIAQDANALKAVTSQPNLRTATVPPAFPWIPTYAEWATPLAGPPLVPGQLPGQLIDRVPDAVCDPTDPNNDGANALRNPIDGSCITEDALGNPRVDANGTRNIGAVQLTLAPFLTVTDTGDGTVDLSWTKPQFSAPTTGITGYELHYREVGTSNWMTDTVSGPDTLTQQVTGLTNGTEYEFEVRATYAPSGTGPWSNNVTGTPFGPIDPPVVTAVPGSGEVQLFWTEPSAGGHPGPLTYVVAYRPVGSVSWLLGPAFLSARTTVIPGLTNGTEYEFGVYAYATDGETSDLGTTKATPFAPGKIIIRKRTAPSGGTGFSFSQTIDGSGDFTLDDQGSKVFTNVTPGAYTVTEADPAGVGPGYRLFGLACADLDPNGTPSTVDFDTRTATINVDSGETVTCEFGNNETETVVVQKRTIPPGGSSAFTIFGSIGPGGFFKLGDTETRTFTNVLPGDYTFQEAAPSFVGYKLTAIDCNVEGQSVAGNLDSQSVNFSLRQPGGSAHCTFTNTQLGTIIMRKETLPDGAADTFDYTINGPESIDSGPLKDGESVQLDNAQPGTWTLEETLPSAGDWHLGDISCTSTLGTSTFTKDIDNLKTTVELAPGDTMDCTFTNVEDETITVEKVTVPAGDTTTSFAFTGSGSIGNFALKDGEKQSFSVNAGNGPYTLTETDPSGDGYEVTEIRCVNSQTGETTLGDLLNRTVALDTKPGESQHCTFTNERHGQVVIRKATAPATAPNNAEFDFYGSFNTFSLKDGQEETFLDVTPGTYSVSEVDPSGLGFGLSGISCTDSDPSGTPSTGDLPTHTATINLDAGETVECTFTNSLPNTVSVFKATIPPGGEGFGFGGNFGPFTLDDGDLRSFNVSQGSSYTISEDENADYDLAFIFCNDASTGEFFEGDVVNRQVTLGPLQEGQQILCEFVNVQRGTIIIEKALGAGTGYAFSGDLGDFSLDSGREETFIEQPVGQYFVSEQTPPGDRLTGLTCSDSDANGVASTGDVASQTATINLDPGETVRCTYTNQPGGSVVIRKAVDSGPDGDFTFLDNIATPATFDLSDGGEQRFDNVLPGTYTVQEAGVPAGSSLANIECTDSDADGTASSTDLTEATAIIQLDPGETVECLFTNEDKVVPVTLGWFLAAGNGGTVNFRWQTATETGTAGFNVLAVTEGGTVQLNRELIPSKVIDSVEPTNYSVALATDAVTFYLQEVGVDGSVTEHGPFTLGREYGAYALPGGVELSPKSWLPILMR